MDEWIFNATILVISFFVGLIIAKYAEDEIRQGKQWFILITILGVLLGILFVFAGSESEYLTFFAIAIIAGISWYRAKFK